MFTLVPDRGRDQDLLFPIVSFLFPGSPPVPIRCSVNNPLLSNRLTVYSMEFFLNGAGHSLNSVNSGNLINHWSMNWAQFKDPVSHMCLSSAVVASRSPTQEVAGSSSLMALFVLSSPSVTSISNESTL